MEPTNEHCEFCVFAGNEQPGVPHRHCDVCGIPIADCKGSLYCDRCIPRLASPTRENTRYYGPPA